MWLGIVESQKPVSQARLTTRVVLGRSSAVGGSAARILVNEDLFDSLEWIRERIYKCHDDLVD
jgi:hypothetical protein